MRPRGGRGWPAALVVLLVVTACSADSTPEPTPVPTTFPVAGPDEAAAVADAFVAAWAADDYAAMYATIDPGQHERYTLESFTDLYASFKRMTRTAGLTATIGTPSTIGLPAEPRPDAIPLPTSTPAPTPDPSAPVDPSATPTSTTPPFDPEQPLDGPVPAISVPLEISVESDRFEEIDQERAMTLVQGEDGWLVRWSPELLFPELGPDGALRLDRELGPRGRIVGAGGVVWAENRDDGARVYPQEALAGQVIGYVSEVTAEDLETLAAEGIGPATSSVARASSPVPRRCCAARPDGRSWRCPTRANQRWCSRPRWFRGRMWRPRFGRPPSSRHRMRWPAIPRAQPPSWIRAAATSGRWPASRGSTRTR